MRRLFTSLLLCAGISVTATAGNLWQQVDAGQAPANLQVMHPNKFQVYTMDEATLKLQMWNLSTDPNESMLITLPLPDGSTRDFKVWQTPMMPADLAAKYPNIKTFTAEAVGNSTVTAKLDFTVYGFHAMIFDGSNTSFIDPFDHYNDGFYMVHYKRDETKAFSDRMKCMVKGKNDIEAGGETMDVAAKPLPTLDHVSDLAQKTVNGWQLRTYRLALACDNQYAVAATGISTPTKAQALSCMTTSMNRINGVYNREFSVQMNFVSNEDTLIFVTPTGDPYSADNANPGNLLTDNQTVCDARIGNANYDLGHVFTTAGGGLSLLGCICIEGEKAQSETGGGSPVGDGFDIDYVAHEMGHEHGANHPFNNNEDGSCQTNAVSDHSYEPGSGSTIMAYAGICDPDDLQYHSDAYFHATSVNEIVAYITNPSGGDVCAVKTATSNKLVSLPSYTASYTIPYKTPFELIGPAATDSVADTATTYCWEEWNLGGSDFGKRLSETYVKGPIFRSYNPVYNSTRIFPKLSMVLSGSLSNAGVEGAEGEKAPDTARYLTFKMTVRDVISGKGCITVPDDTIHLNVVSTGAAASYAGFKVTSQNASGTSYTGGSTETVTWNVVGTSAAPVSATNVDIYMSTDGGNTFPFHLGTYPNNGTRSITVPNPAITSATCRFKVKGNGNVFFNINSANFTVTHNSSIATSTGVAATPAFGNDIKLFPVPASNVLHITSDNTNAIQAVIYNTVGQMIWNGQISNKSDISVASWARGVYYIRFADVTNGSQAVKSFVVE